ncbi:MAG: hypothetical protein RL497_2453 [Pseudomonadota bacterium]
MKFLILSLGVIATLSGCASLTPEECQQADWYLIGSADAQKGYAKLRIDDHRKACAKVHITPDLFTYERGHEKGQKTYCTTPNGFAQGAAGTNYQGACEGYLAEDFLRGYRDGQELYQARSRVDQLYRDIDNYHSDIARMRREINEKQSLMANESNNERRRELLARIQQLQNDVSYAERNLYNAERERGPAEQNFRRVENRMRSFGY